MNLLCNREWWIVTLSVWSRQCWPDGRTEWWNNINTDITLHSQKPCPIAAIWVGHLTIIVCCQYQRWAKACQTRLRLLSMLLFPLRSSQVGNGLLMEALKLILGVFFRWKVRATTYKPPWRKMVDCWFSSPGRQIDYWCAAKPIIQSRIFLQEVKFSCLKELLGIIFAAM